MVLSLVLLGCGLIDLQGTASAGAQPGQTPTIHTQTIVSAPYHIDKMYASMRGPYGFDDVRLIDGEQVELLWIVG